MASKTWRCPKCASVMVWSSEMATSRCVRCAVEQHEVQLLSVGSWQWALLAVSEGKRVWHLRLGPFPVRCDGPMVLEHRWDEGWYLVKSWEPRKGEQVHGFDEEGNEWTGPYHSLAAGAGPGEKHWLGAGGNLVLVESITPLDSDFEVVDHG